MAAHCASGSARWRATQLIVSDGGRVLNINGCATIGNTGSNNLARVTGSGSVWSNFAGLNIGVTYL